MWVTAVFDMSSHLDAGPCSLSTEVPTGRMTLVIPSEARNLLFACSPPALWEFDHVTRVTSPGAASHFLDPA